MNDSRATEADTYIGTNVRRNREAAGITQVELAQFMTERGWQWHQSTVARVEGGHQSLRLPEAVDLAEVLGTGLRELTWSGQEANGRALVDRSTAILHREGQDLATAVVRLLAARSSGERVLAEHMNSQYKGVREACDDLRLELESTTLETAINEGTYRYEKEGTED